MESVIRVLKTKSFTLNIMKFSWVVLIVVYAFGYGHIFSILEPSDETYLSLERDLHSRRVLLYDLRI